MYLFSFSLGGTNVLFTSVSTDSNLSFETSPGFKFFKGQKISNYGGFQLLDLIIPELKSHVIPYKFKSSHWLKLQHSDWRANLVKDFFYK